MSDSISSPYSRISNTMIIEIEPDQLNNNLSLNIKNKLKEMEGKCIYDYGCIILVHNVVKFNRGVIREYNEDGLVTFNVTFNCRICRPLKDMIIGCKIDNINQNLMKLSNGPIIIVIQNEHVNSNEFRFDSIQNTIKHIKSGQELKVGNLVKVLIYQTRFTYKDTKIFAIGQLLNVLNESETELYNNDLLMNKEENYFDIK